MSRRRQQLRQQINESLSEPILGIEHRIADSLAAEGEFHSEIDDDELGLILRKVIYRIVDEQKVANVSVPILHNITQMDARIHASGALVECEVHVHEPIIAFIRLKYALENDPASCGTRLRLKDDRLEVREITRPLDVGAKLALKMLRIENIVRHELSDPNGLIKRMLYQPLEQYGYTGVVHDVELEFNGTNSLRVYITGEKAS
ncbi:MAG: hypothetical protein U0521_05905 [Anaerolineae bacterium]